MDFTLCDYGAGYRAYQDCFPELAYPQSVAGFYENLAPLEGAIETSRRLHEQPQLALFILTAPSIMNPHSYSEKSLWIETFLCIGHQDSRDFTRFWASCPSTDSTTRFVRKPTLRWEWSSGCFYGVCAMMVSVCTTSRGSSLNAGNARSKVFLALVVVRLMSSFYYCSSLSPSSAYQISGAVS